MCHLSALNTDRCGHALNLCGNHFSRLRLLLRVHGGHSRFLRRWGVHILGHHLHVLRFPGFRCSNGTVLGRNYCCPLFTRALLWPLCRGNGRQPKQRRLLRVISLLSPSVRRTCRRSLRTSTRSAFTAQVRKVETDLSISLFQQLRPYRRSSRSCATTCCSGSLARMDSAGRPLRR